MGKARELPRPKAQDDDEVTGRAVVPTVDYEDPPPIRIYDGTDTGAYWFRRAGFTSKLTDP